MIQLLLFPETEEEILRREIQDVKQSLDKQRKKLFAENSALKKMMLEVRYELETFKSAICKGQINDQSKPFVL